MKIIHIILNIMLALYNIIYISIKGVRKRKGTQIYLNINYCTTIFTFKLTVKVQF